MGGIYIPGPSTTRKVLPCATKCYTGNNIEDVYTVKQTRATSTTYRYKHHITEDCENIRLVYGNASAETLGGNTITVKAGIEDASGNRFPAFFGGAARTQTIQPGALIESDPIGVRFAKGDVVWSWQYVVGTHPIGNAVNGLSGGIVGEGMTASDIVDSGAITADLTYGYGPLNIKGDVATTARCIGLIGDSVGVGYNAGASPYNNPFLLRALGTNFGGDYSHVMAALSGDSLVEFVKLQQNAKRMALLRGCTHVICQLSGNDIFNGANLVTLQARAAAVWALFTRYGLKVYQTTCTPKSSSSDSWVTVNNQTTDATNAVRVTFNNWIRTTPAGLSGFFDVADYCESARDSGKWIANYTNDGIHIVGATASAAVAAAVSSKLPGIL